MTAILRKSLACAALALAASLAALPAPAPGREAQSASEDPVIEKRMMDLAEELRCLVCQNQTIADSNADLAADLRNQIRTMLKDGATDAQVRDYMTARYGDFVLYRPPLKGTTALLWFGPALLLVAGFVVLFRALRRRSQLPEDALSPDEEARASALLGRPEDLP